MQEKPLVMPKNFWACDKIHLRSCCEADVEIYVNEEKDSESIRFLEGRVDPPRAAALWKEWIDRQAKQQDPNCLAFTIESLDQQIVGFANIRDWTNRAGWYSHLQRLSKTRLCFGCRENHPSVWFFWIALSKSQFVDHRNQCQIDSLSPEIRVSSGRTHQTQWFYRWPLLWRAFIWVNCWRIYQRRQKGLSIHIKGSSTQWPHSQRTNGRLWETKKTKLTCSILSRTTSSRTISDWSQSSALNYCTFLRLDPTWRSSIGRADHIGRL